jgi:hypothetical protein
LPRRPHPAATGAAKRLIDELQIRSPSEIDIELIAAHLNLHVKRSPLQHEEGRLLRAGDTGVVAVADRAYRSMKWRFVIAHEIGHFVRHPDADSYAICTSADLSAYLGSGREVEANDYASELLMPGRLFAPRCDRSRPSLKVVSDLAEAFMTSLTSTAIRFVMFAPEPCAVVCSTSGVVRWLDWSPNFRLGIKKGTRLTSRTYAGDLFAGTHVDDRLQQVDGDAWSDNPWAAELDLFEHSRKVSSDSVLTFLWHPSS